MANLLSLLNTGLGAAANLENAALEGREVGRQRKDAGLLAQLKAAQEAEDRALRSRLTEAQIRNYESLASDRQEPTKAPSYGTGLHEVIDPKTGRRVLVQASSAGGASAVPFEPVPEAAPKGPQGSPVTMVSPEGTPVFFNPTTGARVEAPKGLALPGSDRTSAATRVKLAENERQLSVIDQALADLATHPEAVGLKRGIGKVPGLGGVADVINQRVDPEGVAARMGIANIGSMQIHDRSGAAVSVSEFPRLAPFVPDVADTPETIRTKLTALKRELGVVINALEGGASLADVARGGGSPAAPAAGATREQQLWDAAVAKHGRAKVEQTYGPRP